MFVTPVHLPSLLEVLKYFALIMNILILLTSGWTSFVGGFDISMFLSNYLDWSVDYFRLITSLLNFLVFSLIFPAVYFGCKLWYKDSFVRLDDIDFTTELTKIEHELVLDEGGIAPLSSYDRYLNAFF